MPLANDNLLGTYLKDRRTKLDPAAMGFPLARRRTPGLRREEVAQRANVSATWYTWLFVYSLAQAFERRLLRLVFSGRS